MNYTGAEITCENQNGFLANILSAIRTNFFSSLIYQRQIDINKSPQPTVSPTNTTSTSPTNIAIKHAFVGLKETQRKGKFINPQDVPIECFLYRAWEPNYPK